MLGMSEFPDNFFDLAIVDVPYGIGESNKAYLRGGKQPGNALAVSTEFTRKEWDKQPPWEETLTVDVERLIRICKEYALFGKDVEADVDEMTLIRKEDNSE